MNVEKDDNGEVVPLARRELSPEALARIDEAIKTEWRPRGDNANPRVVSMVHDLVKNCGVDEGKAVTYLLNCFRMGATKW
jgi:hypothetical protein